MPANSDVGFERVRNKLDVCNKNHAACFRALSGDLLAQETILPTRVIEIDEQGTKAFIRETSGLTGKYVALSYCWGHPSEASGVTLTK